MLPEDMAVATTPLAVTGDRLPLEHCASPKAVKARWVQTDKPLQEELEETTEDLAVIPVTMALTDRFLPSISKKLAVLTMPEAVEEEVTTDLTEAQAMPEEETVVANPILSDILLRLILVAVAVVLLNTTDITMAVLAVAGS